MKKNSIYLLIVLLAYVSCVSRFKTGVYTSVEKSEPYQFVFYDDSLFTYKNNSYEYRHSSGVFKIVGNKIILNSEKKDVYMPLLYTMVSLDSVNNKNCIIVKLNISEFRKFDDYTCIPIINCDTMIQYIDSLNPYLGVIMPYRVPSFEIKDNVVTIFYEKELDSIRFEVEVSPFVLRGRPRVYSKTVHFDKLLGGQSLLFNIEIDDGLFGYVVFDNAELVFKRNKVIYRDERYRYQEPLYLRTKEDVDFWK
ncbi:hypothetical protein [Dysgonomonas massiliensis]|uniref:hypothetical protein n=1 Tax=Dysgonomonas massiliensis TaxID=2040292 RepID=UPI000C7721E9|nr:hypothetical protein [Dysgonomonas massiliensis]